MRFPFFYIPSCFLNYRVERNLSVDYQGLERIRRLACCVTCCAKYVGRLERICFPVVLVGARRVPSTQRMECCNSRDVSRAAVGSRLPPCHRCLLRDLTVMDDVLHHRHASCASISWSHGFQLDPDLSDTPFGCPGTNHLQLQCSLYGGLEHTPDAILVTRKWLFT